jgi:signal transduction histidine kinase
LALIIYLFQKRKLKYNRQIDNIKSEYDKAILDSQLEIQEQTIENISKEIHDNIGLSLTLAKLNLNTLNKDSSPDYKEKIEHTVDLLTSAIQDLRNLSQSMNADLVKTNGLIRTVEEEAKRINRSGQLNAILEITGEPAFMDTQKELLLFRIIQESMNNILKHAEASNAFIILDYGNEVLTLQVKDDGKGFAPPTDQGSGGSGLSNLKARTTMLKGTMELQSGIKGTLLTFKIPYN